MWKLAWEFGGADIFVSTDNEEEFKLEDDGILLTDFAKVKYKIDFNGNLIWDTFKNDNEYIGYLASISKMVDY